MNQLPFTALAVTFGLASLAHSQSFGSRTFGTSKATDLGTFRVATQTWIPAESSFSAITLTESIYDNTCLPMTVMGTPTVNRVTLFNNMEMLASTGQIPSSSNTILAGSADSYTVRGWRWAYCPGEPLGMTMVASFHIFESLASCNTTPTPAALGTPIFSVDIVNLPPGGPSQPCFIFNIDLEGTGLEFNIQGDGDGVFDGPGAGNDLDTFGMMMGMVRTDGGPFQGVNGFGLAGDPGTNDFSYGCQDATGAPGPGGFIGDSTSFQNPMHHIDGATGLGTDDWMESVGGPGITCFNFGGGYHTSQDMPFVIQNPWASLHCEIFGDPNIPPVTLGLDQCNGDGGNQMGCTNCPCGNNAPQGTLGGCLNSAGTSARILASGSDSISAGDVRIEMVGAPPFSFSLLFSGAKIAPGNMANPCFGLNSGLQSMLFDGLRCALMTLRHGGRTVQPDGTVGMTNGGWGPPNGPANGMGGIPAQGGFMPGETRHFQAFMRDFSDQVCMRGQNTSQAISITFVP